MIKKIALSVFGIFSFSNYAIASQISRSSPFLISARAGTLGAGPEINYHRQNTHWGVRGDFDYYAVSISDIRRDHANFSAVGPGYTEKGSVAATYGGHAKLINGSIFADYYPWSKSAFRLTTGAIFSGSFISGKGIGHATGSMTSRMGTRPFDIPNAGYVAVKAHYAPAAPYFGLGFSSQIAGNFYANLDAGVMIHDNASVSLAPGGMMNQFPKAYARLHDAAYKRIRNYMDDRLPVYPVVMLGFGYRI
ncbi:hypothetical protein [Acetobacter persici]|uniref:hypothetical protein n=1 Tax=Acetobacter persici TaxID=1076596 RepID=UPI0012FE6EFE|nr:hypothetical protein [Acetobacter persici]